MQSIGSLGSFGAAQYPTMPFQQKGEEGRYVTETEVVKLIRKGNVYFGNRVCPFAHRAWWTAKEVGFEPKMDYVHIELGDNKPAWYAGINIFGTVPCLYVDGHRICESSIVAMYMNEAEKGDLMPTNVIQRADTRLLTQFWDSHVLAKLYTVLRTEDAEDRKKVWEELAEKLELFNHFFEEFKQKDGPYFLGNELSMVEINIMPFIARFALLLPRFRGIDMFKHAHIPAVEKAYRAVLQRPAFAATNLEAGQYSQFYYKYVHGDKAIRKAKAATGSCPSLGWSHVGLVAAGAVAGAAVIHFLKRAS